VREEEVSIQVPGEALPAYLAAPDGWPPGPGVVVVQEWWGLDEHIRDVARRLAGEGFAALAPDLYRGRQATEPDDARKLLMEAGRDRMLSDLQAAVGWLLENGAGAVGAIGFCMGGGLVWRLAHADDRLGAASPFYGNAEIDGMALKVPVVAHFGGADHGITSERIGELTRHLADQGVPHEVNVYEGAPHAFFNDTRPAYRADAARQAWHRTLDFLHHHLGSAARARG
jgi:carboxymethylenebutenolidase